MSTKKILFKSSDGHLFEADEAVARQSTTISHSLEDCCAKADDEFLLPNVSGNILSLVIEYCKKHADVGSISEEDLKKWDAEFVLGMDQPTFFDLIRASNYQNIPSLIALTCQTIANLIADPNEIRATFEIKNDFTPEEEEKGRQENRWAFHLRH